MTDEERQLMEALKAEVEESRAFIKEIANWKPSDQPFAGNQAEFAFRRFQGTARTLRVKYNPTKKG